MQRVFLAVLLAASAAFQAQAVVPSQFSYQGFLTTPAGVPVSATLTMQFRLYDAPTGGELAWSESQTVTVSNGVFNAVLGAVTPITVVFDRQYYLEVQVGTDPPMAPRQVLASVPYASATGLSSCDFGDILTCYPGAPGTRDVGPCKAGTRDCNPATLTYGLCMGHVIPTAETYDGIDNNCDGTVDNLPGSSTLTAIRAGNGFGTVSSVPPGIACGADCEETYGNGTSVTLTALAATGSVFSGWSGEGCSGMGTCSFPVLAPATATATFTLSTHTLTVTRAGTGTGSVTSSPAGVNCGADCSEIYNYGTVVTLTATPATGSIFAGWSGGACTGTGTCVTTVTAAAAVTATFTLTTHTLTVTRAGNGAGIVTSSPAGINCGADCTEIYNYGTTVTLTAVPAVGSVFAGWSGGGCSGTGTCTTTMTAARSVTATFPLTQHTLSVVRSGTGTGTVTSSPAGINCGADCVEIYNYGTIVILTATPSGGSSFAGWSGGGCSGTGTCVTTVTAAATVTATFHITLTVVRSGGGAITSVPAGISCGADCTQAYATATSVTLTATPDPGWSFAGWSGAGCTGTGTCTINVAANTTVSATFNPSLTILVTGSGSVTSPTVGIKCSAGGGTCSVFVGLNSTIMLIASPTNAFLGWGGDASFCFASPTCQLTLSSLNNVTASFQ
jgi:hypothetical protein